MQLLYYGSKYSETKYLTIQVLNKSIFLVYKKEDDACNYDTTRETIV